MADTPDDLIGQIAQYNPRILAYQKAFLKDRKFKGGNLSKIGTISIDFLLRENVSRRITTPEFVALDKSLSLFFNTDPGK